ncbi:hypothetical protein Bca52824_077642 [Brassica carinata]|uniref:Uncharacterized protein n=1 Tax=Brassica carinata TaxID=52824 RepID=A0A8X7PXL3_BRACI|nr:hypothetical protein Bca52824_077642 [Brassica carinata]
MGLRRRRNPQTKTLLPAPSPPPSAVTNTTISNDGSPRGRRNRLRDLLVARGAEKAPRRRAPPRSRALRSIHLVFAIEGEEIGRRERRRRRRLRNRIFRSG